MRACAWISVLIVSGWMSMPAAAETEAKEAKARRVAEEVLAAVGGAEGWEATNILRFTFGDWRTHYWNTHTGQHRVEGKTREGERYVVLHDLDDRTGRAWLNGEEVGDEGRQEWLDKAWQAWVNDTYWLLLPFKLLDPGVKLEYQGLQPVDGEELEVLKLSFDSVGLTPGDRYWVYVDPETRLIRRWAYILEHEDAAGPATHWVWSDWKTYGKIRLASGRHNPDADRGLPLTNIAVFEELPERVFSSPEPVEPDEAPPAPASDR